MFVLVNLVTLQPYLVHNNLKLVEQVAVLMTSRHYNFRIGKLSDTHTFINNENASSFSVEFDEPQSIADMFDLTVYNITSIDQYNALQTPEQTNDLEFIVHDLIGMLEEIDGFEQTFQNHNSKFGYFENTLVSLVNTPFSSDTRHKRTRLNLIPINRWLHDKKKFLTFVFENIDNSLIIKEYTNFRNMWSVQFEKSAAYIS